MTAPSKQLRFHLQEWELDFEFFAECKEVLTPNGIYALTQLTRRERYEAQGAVQGYYIEKVRKTLIRERANLTFKLKLRELNDTLTNLSTKLSVIAAIDRSLPFIVCQTALFPDHCWASYALGGARDDLCLGDYDINRDFGFTKRQIRYVDRIKAFCDLLPRNYPLFSEEIYNYSLKLDLIKSQPESFNCEDLKSSFEIED